MISSGMLRRCFLVIAFVAGVVTAFGQLPRGFSFQVNGQVRYADSKAPVENAIVRLESFGGGMTDQVMTDRMGKFTFSRLVGAHYVVTIHMPGYIDFSEDVNLIDNNSWYINAMLVADRSSLVNIRNKGGNTNLDLLAPAVIDSRVPIEAQNEYSKGKQLLDQGKKDRVDDAIRHLQQAITIYPAFLEAHLVLGLTYMDSQNWERAESTLKAATEINPQASTAHFALGEVYRQEKKYSEAEKVLVAGLKANDASAGGHHTLAKVYWEMAHATKDQQQFKLYLENSWKEIDQCLTLNPKLAAAHLLAGNLLLRARRAEASLQHFEEYLKLEPNGEYAAQTREMVDKIKQALPKQKEKN